MSQQPLYERISEISKRRGFFWPSFEIYGGLSGFITYGDLGTKLKRNIEDQWREFFVRPQGFLELEAPVVNPEIVFSASGHLENFKEFSSECSQCGKSFRADHLVEDKTGLKNVESMGEAAIRKLLEELNIRCPNCGGVLKEPVTFLTMFKTEIGATGGDVGYARPEPAQGMFINFKRGYLQAREKLPFALAQVGKVLRNEISPRRGIIRLREFTIMELELFFDPMSPSCHWIENVANDGIKLLTEEMLIDGITEAVETTVKEALKQGLIQTEWQAYFMGVGQRFVSFLGVNPINQRFRAHLPEERAHYSMQTFDHEALLDAWGWTEIAGYAYRTDYDLKAHKEGSGQEFQALRDDGTRYIPHVVEPSFGLSRLLYLVMEANYERRNKRNIFRFPRELSPFHVSVFPLVTKDGLPEKTREITDQLLNEGFTVFYDDRGSIGRRYARSDEAGIPLALTIDYETLKDNSVTIRDRNTWQQVRTNIGDLPNAFLQYFRRNLEFSQLGHSV